MKTQLRDPKGKVAVIESASDASHWPGRDRRRLVETFENHFPWLALDRYDESDVSWLLGGHALTEYAAVLFTAGAMQKAQVRSDLNSNAANVQLHISQGMGVLVSAAFMTDADDFELQFLPGSQAATVLTLNRAELPKGSIFRAGKHVRVIQGTSYQSTKVTLGTDGSVGWSVFMSVGESVDQAKPVAWRTEVGRGRVIFTSLPFERLEDQDLLIDVVSRLTRPNGYLSIAPKGERPLDRRHAPTDSRVFFYSEELQDEVNIQQLENVKRFSHLILMSQEMLDNVEVDWILRRLENGGSIEFVPSGALAPSTRLLISGTPRYLSLLRQAESVLLSRLESMPGGPTFDLVALAFLAHGAREVTRDSLLIPHLFRLESQRDLCRRALDARESGGNVDNILLPTMNVYVAGTLCQLNDSRLEKMRKWLNTRIREELTPEELDDVAQVLWFDKRISEKGLTDQTISDGLRPLEGFDRETIFTHVTSVLGRTNVEGIDAAVAESSPWENFAGLDLALMCFANAPQTPWPIPSSLESINTEEMCFGLASEIVHVKDFITSGGGSTEQELDWSPNGDIESLRVELHRSKQSLSESKRTFGLAKKWLRRTLIALSLSATAIFTWLSWTLLDKPEISTEWKTAAIGISIPLVVTGIGALWRHNELRQLTGRTTDRSAAGQ